MNSRVSRVINGNDVSARPVYKGGTTPAYWVALVNERTLAKTFPSASAAFRFVALRRGG